MIKRNRPTGIGAGVGWVERFMHLNSPSQAKAKPTVTKTSKLMKPGIRDGGLKGKNRDDFRNSYGFMLVSSPSTHPTKYIQA